MALRYSESMDNSMMWVNPNPKKKTQQDNGTATWGDPGKQGTIKRWKRNDGLPEDNPEYNRKDHHFGTSWLDDTTVDNSASLTNTFLRDEDTATPTPQSNGLYGISPWFGDAVETTPVSSAQNSTFNQYWTDEKTSRGPVSQAWGNFGGGDGKTAAPYMDLSSSSSRLPSNTISAPGSSLTHQITEKLIQCVQIGLLDSSILHESLTSGQKETLHQFLQCLSKLEKAQGMYMGMQTSTMPFPNRQQDMQYVATAIQQLIVMMNSLRQKLQTDIGSQRADPFPPMYNARQSKLDQWRGATPTNFSENINLPGPMVPPFIDQSGTAWPVSNLSEPWASDYDAMTRNQSQIGAAKGFNDTVEDDVVNTVYGAVSQEISLNDSKRFDGTSTPIEDSGAELGRENTTTASLSNTFDANVPEFVPGRPWLWRDPKELAADPDLTPSSFISKKAALSNTNYVENSGSNAWNGFWYSSYN